jgi:hypothetical protein
MTRKAKVPTTLRLTEETRRELASAAKMHGISQADVISVLIHCWTKGIDYDDWADYFDLARQA